MLDGCGRREGGCVVKVGGGKSLDERQRVSSAAGTVMCCVLCVVCCVLWFDVDVASCCHIPVKGVGHGFELELGVHNVGAGHCERETTLSPLPG